MTATPAPYTRKVTIGGATLSLGHTFVGCESDSDHFEVACQRVQAFYQEE